MDVKRVEKENSKELVVLVDVFATKVSWKEHRLIW
jgi:hypothetical protein